MKKFVFIIRLSVGFLFIGVIGCSPVRAIIPTTLSISPSPTPFVTISLTPTLQPTLMPTTLPSVTFALTETPTLEATMDFNQSQSYVLDLIRTNHDCRFSCFWGITPGETLWSDAYRYLGHFVSPISDYEHADGVWHSFIKQIRMHNQMTDIEISFIERDNHIDFIQGVINSDDFKKYLQPFQVRDIIQVYGVPSRMMVFLPSLDNTEAMPYVGYRLWLFYDKNGFVIKYFNGAQVTGDHYHFCPAQFHSSYLGPVGTFAETFGSIQFTSQSLENQRPLDRLLENKDFQQARSITEASGLGLDEILKRINQNEVTACFDTPIKFWQK